MKYPGAIYIPNDVRFVRAIWQWKKIEVFLGAFVGWEESYVFKRSGILEVRKKDDAFLPTWTLGKIERNGSKIAYTN